MLFRLPLGLYSHRRQELTGCQAPGALLGRVGLALTCPSPAINSSPRHQHHRANCEQERARGCGADRKTEVGSGGVRLPRPCRKAGSGSAKPTPRRCGGCGIPPPWRPRRCGRGSDMRASIGQLEREPEMGCHFCVFAPPQLASINTSLPRA